MARRVVARRQIEEAVPLGRVLHVDCFPGQVNVREATIVSLRAGGPVGIDPEIVR